MEKNIYWLNENSRKFLSSGYLMSGESAEERILHVSKTAESLLAVDDESNAKVNSYLKCGSFSEKFLDYLERGFYSLSSPNWSNFGRKRGLPISCFGSYVEDSIESITGHKLAEISVMTKSGGGTSAYFGDIRSRGSKISSGGESTGSVHFMELYDKMMTIVSQGNTRRGACAVYLPIDHGDIEEFLKIKSEGNDIQSLSIGVCVSNQWMRDMVDGDKEKRRIWGLVIQKRFESGYPYIFFSDNANDQAPQVYKDKNLKITHSNVCNEIMLADSPTESFVCNLSSLNLDKWEEWKDTDAVETMVFFLDAVMTEFINKTENMAFMKDARNFAINQRALGIGVLGWHSLLQSKMISFESMEAKILNNQIWKTIRNRADAATEKLAEIYGEPALLEGYGRRNVTTLAVAPTVSSSFILGQVSQGIEPLNGNYFVKGLAKGDFSYQNPYLEKLLIEKNQNSPEVWKSILIRGGSVAHLDFLSENEKATFKTFGEISQKEIIIQAAQRQKYIDQGQSLNIMIPPSTSVKEVNQLMIFAWEQGIKGLYYQKSANPAQELARSILNCESCQA